MTETEWLTKARTNRAKLVALVGSFHPANLGFGRITHNMPITAPTAEGACRVVRSNIRKNFEGDPVVQLNEALDAGNISKIESLLNDTWFGVPESAYCWRLEGFREAVSLIEDPPDNEEAE